MNFLNKRVPFPPSWIGTTLNQNGGKIMCSIICASSFENLTDLREFSEAGNPQA